MKKHISLIDLIIVISLIAIIMQFVTWKKDSTQIPQSTPGVTETEIPVSPSELIETKISKPGSSAIHCSTSGQVSTKSQTGTIKPDIPSAGNISYKNAVGEFYDSDDNQQVKKISRIIKKKDIANINFKIVTCDEPGAILFEKDLGNPYLNGTGCDLNPGTLPSVRVKDIMDVRDKNNKSLIIIEKEVQLYVLSSNQIEIKLTKYLSD